MNKSHEHTPPHEEVVFVSLKGAHSHEQVSQRKLKILEEESENVGLHEAHCVILTVFSVFFPGNSWSCWVVRSSGHKGRAGTQNKVGSLSC